MPQRLSCVTGLLCLLLGVAGCPQPPTGDPTGGDARLNVAADDHVLSVGSPKVTVIAYEDIQCPVCGRFERDIFPTIRAEYVDTGRVRWVFRHFPLTSIHPQAQAAAEAAECAADQGAFFAFTEAQFANQSGFSRTRFEETAAALGLDAAAFSICLDGGTKAPRVQRDSDSGVGLGVTGTPTFFVGGVKLVGTLDLETWRAILDAQLAAAE